MTLDALSISPDFVLGAITGGFTTLATWQFSTSAKVNMLMGRFDEHCRGHKNEVR